ncbi:MAG TPA: NUDIX hydrolase [candidate division Zixibacteria bacterium]|nr:NUDIX hydrolase [candidate division Zixibacteria bacterium]
MSDEPVSSTRPFEGRLISLRLDRVRLRSGRTATREVVEHPGAVGIVAWDGARLAMVSQWRHAVSATLLEIPAGTLDPGEEPLATARRELAEECSLAADNWERGPSFYTAPGFCTERLTLFLATGLHEVDGHPEADEELTPSWLTLDEALVAVDDGRVVDAKSIVAILWLARRRPA